MRSICWRVIRIRHCGRWRKVVILWFENGTSVPHRFLWLTYDQVWATRFILLKGTLRNTWESNYRPCRFIISNIIKTLWYFNILPFQSFNSILKETIVLFKRHQFFVDLFNILRIIKVDGLKVRIVTWWLHLHRIVNRQDLSPRILWQMLLVEYGAFEDLNFLPQSDVFLLDTVKFIIFAIERPSLHVYLFPQRLICTEQLCHFGHWINQTIVCSHNLIFVNRHPMLQRLVCVCIWLKFGGLIFERGEIFWWLFLHGWSGCILNKILLESNSLCRFMRR